MKKNLLSVLLFSSLSCSVVAQELNVDLLGRYTDGREGACEISSYDKGTARVFTTNGAADSIDIVDVSNVSAPMKIGGIAVTNYGGGVNSVVVVNGEYLAAAIEAENAQEAGKIVFFDLDGVMVSEVTVGALPDMVTVSPDGTKVICANEGEPNDEYTVDPNGSVSIIDITGGVAALTNANVTTLEFTDAPEAIAGSLRKPGTTWAQDLEPEYVAVTENSEKAFVICQEANVLVTVDLTNNTVLSYTGLGFKDHSLEANKLDASNEDGVINIRNWNVKGVYQPDAIATFTTGGVDYVLTANEGDGRDYDGYSSETRIKDLELDATVFPNASELQAETSLGRLKTFTPEIIGDTDGDGDVDELYSYGARSFSIWNSEGLVWDSGDDFEMYIEENHADFFNCNDGLASKFDNRSDDKGPEPEAVVVGRIGENVYAFVGLERQGGVMVYNITDPANAYFVDYIHSLDEANGTSTDVAPEGLIFVSAAESHNDKNMLIVSNEVSGTTVIYEVADASVTTVSDVDGLNVEVYPNPVQDVLKVALNETANYEYVLMNALGQTVKIGQFSQFASINIENEVAGMYILTIKDVDTKKTSTRKVVKK